MSIYRITLERPAWMLEAACARVDPDLWFPSPGDYPVEAKRICQACPHQMPCLAYALDTGERYGVWGGKTEKERQRILAAGTTRGECSLDRGPHRSTSPVAA